MTVLRDLNEVKYSNLSTDYYLKDKKYTRQYAPLYAERLKSMRDEVKKAAKEKWNYPFKNLVDMEKNEKCIIIGTLYKEMKFKPNILKELAEDENGQIAIQSTETQKERYLSDEDKLILEDELQRVELIDCSRNQTESAKWIVKESRLCTGLVLALLGFENEDSRFEIEDICFKETPISSKLQLKKANQDIDSQKYIVFISGIELGNEKLNENLYKFQLFVDFLRGDFIDLDDKSDENKRLNRILQNTVRVVIAGNSLSSSTQSKDMHNKAKYLTKNFVVGSVSAIKELDKFLSQLIEKVEVDVMPGEYDPSNLMLPQQPLHNAIFTNSKVKTNPRCDNFHTTTNPYRFSINDVDFLGTSGQFIDDIKRNTKLDEPIDIMKMSIQSGHMAPTCPDTLACYPFYGKDPFILKKLPHVYFAGNQNSFKHDHVEMNDGTKVHLLSLPKFSVSSSCVFFNIDTFESEEFFF